MISKAEIDIFLQFQEMVTDAAEELLMEENAIRQIDGASVLCVTEIDESTIELVGERTWQYGGYEEYNHRLPTKALYDKQARQEYLDEIKNRK